MHYMNKLLELGAYLLSINIQYDNTLSTIIFYNIYNMIISFAITM